jgi:hypothetical protein
MRRIQENQKGNMTQPPRISEVKQMNRGTTTITPNSSGQNNNNEIRLQEALQRFDAYNQTIMDKLTKYEKSLELMLLRLEQQDYFNQELMNRMGGKGGRNELAKAFEQQQTLYQDLKNKLNESKPQPEPEVQSNQNPAPSETPRKVESNDQSINETNEEILEVSISDVIVPPNTLILTQNFQVGDFIEVIFGVNLENGIYLNVVDHYLVWFTSLGNLTFTDLRGITITRLSGSNRETISKKLAKALRG